MINNQNFETFKKEIDAYIEEESVSLAKGDYNAIYTVEQGSDRANPTEKTYSGPGLMRRVGLTGNAITDNPLDGYKTVYQLGVYRKEVQFDSTAMETDQSDEIEKMARGLPRTIEYSRSAHTFSLIRRMEDPTMVGGDGKQLLSVAHPRKDGNGTQSNTFVDGVQRELTYDNAVILRNVLRSQVSNTGNLLGAGDPRRKMCLWVSRDLEERAFQIAGTGMRPGGNNNLVKKPDTANNDRNYFVEGVNFDVLVLDFVSHEIATQAGETSVAKSSSLNNYDTRWGICDPAIMKEFFKVKFLIGYDSGLITEDVNHRNQVVSKFANDKYSFGYTSWLGFTGSLGDDSTLAI